MVTTHTRRTSTTADPPPTDPSDDVLRDLTTTGRLAPDATGTATSRPTTRRDDIAAAVFSTWVVIGLFLDGWAHRADKPETFFTPWHAVLYSGFVAGMLWFGVNELRDRRRQIEESGRYQIPDDRWVLAGFGCFAAAGVADMVWHGVFGIEEDVAALLSPVHLLLMGGGLLLVTSPVRSALRLGGQAPLLRTFAPAAVGITLAVAVLAFFLQFASVLTISDEYSLERRGGEVTQALGITAVLLPNALLLGAVLWTLLRWRFPPVGTFTLVFGGTALLMAGLEGFERLPLVLPVTAAGATADLLVVRGARLGTVLTVTPLVLWSSWFALHHATWGVEWEVELWTGSIVFTVLTGLGLSLLPGRGAGSVATGPERVP
jgi:hypothetical protein